MRVGRCTIDSSCVIALDLLETRYQFLVMEALADTGVRFAWPLR